MRTHIHGAAKTATRLVTVALGLILAVAAPAEAGHGHGHGGKHGYLSEGCAHGESYPCAKDRPHAHEHEGACEEGMESQGDATPGADA